MEKFVKDMIRQILAGNFGEAEIIYRVIVKEYQQQLKSKEQKFELKQEHDVKQVVETKQQPEEKQESAEEVLKKQIRKYVDDSIFELFKGEINHAIVHEDLEDVEDVLKKFERCLSSLNCCKDGKCKYFFMSADDFFQLKNFLNRSVHSPRYTYIPPLANSYLLSGKKFEILQSISRWVHRREQNQLIKLLVKYGADINILFMQKGVQYSILTELLIHHIHEPEELAKRLEFFLKELNAKLDIRIAHPSYSKLPIAFFAEWGLLESVKKMIEHKSEVRGVDKFGGSVLHAALEFKGDSFPLPKKIQQFKELIEYLVKFDKKLLIIPTTGNDPSNSGMIPLHCAVKNKDIPAEIIDFLLDLHFKHPELEINQGSKECIMELTVQRVSDAMVMDKPKWSNIFSKLMNFIGLPIFSLTLQAQCNVPGINKTDLYIDTLVTLDSEINKVRAFHVEFRKHMSGLTHPLPPSLRAIVCDYALPVVTLRARSEANWGQLEAKEATESKCDEQSVQAMITRTAQPNSGSPLSSGLGLGGTPVPQNGSDPATELSVTSLSLDDRLPINRT